MPTSRFCWAATTLIVVTLGSSSAKKEEIWLLFFFFLFWAGLLSSGFVSGRPNWSLRADFTFLTALRGEQSARGEERQQLVARQQP